MHRNRFEMYRGRILFKPKLPVTRSKGWYCSVRKVIRGSLAVNYFLTIFDIKRMFVGLFCTYIDRI